MDSNCGLGVMAIFKGGFALDPEWQHVAEVFSFILFEVVLAFG